MAGVRLEKRDVRPSHDVTSDRHANLAHPAARISQYDKKNSATHRCVFLTLLNAQLNPICHLLALLGAYHILHVSGIRVKTMEKFLWLIIDVI